MGVFNASQKIGEIVSILPKASEVFKKYKIDFCCGGHRPLSEAIMENSLSEVEILSQLNEAYEEAIKHNDQTDFRKMSSVELIDYIVNTHHSYLNINLPEISDLTATILRVHGANHNILFKVHKLFHSLKTELEQHLIKEEVVLFPLMKEYYAKPSEELYNQIISVMKETEDEHDGAGDILKELREITEDYKVPEDGCGTYHRTFDKLQELEADLFQHIHLENNILFKKQGTVLYK